MKPNELIMLYVQAVEKQFTTGHAKEHAYRPALQRLMSAFDDVVAVNDPRRSAYGNPDFIFLKASHQNIILGYAEAKDIDIGLDKTEKTDQMNRYAGYENLFLSNYLEFRFFQNGNKYQTVTIGAVKNGQLTFYPENFGQLEDELSQFLSLPPESIKSGKRLAQIMGAKARRIRDNVSLYLKHEENEQNQEIEKIYGLMKELLVHDLTSDKFADMYAQTLVYGLFVARHNDPSPESFTRSEARDLVPASNPFLREFFDHIVGPRFDKRLSYIVDELCEVFSVSDVHKLVQMHLRLFEVDNEKDPIIHFYEDFLKEYDPMERKKMGAYYTPIPVVRFIVKQVDDVLKEDFDLKGLADNTKRPYTVHLQGVKHKIDIHRVQILDPAVGTATFLNETIKHIQKTFEGQEGRWGSYVTQDLLPRLHGFELMMAPYTIAHLKLGMTLQGEGIDNFDQRLGVYLTNTLDEGTKRQQDLFNIGLAEIVTKESQKATEIKHERPIMVILGNPPYSGHSSNITPYAQSLIMKYKRDVPELKRPAQAKWLSDDYVKFIAFAEDMILKNGEGVMAMITNNAYLDNPTFKGMRKKLLQSFDVIKIMDLHGSYLKRETAEDGSRDENVFDIQQGVSVIIASKTGKKPRKALAQVKHAELYGRRKYKFEKLKSQPDWKDLDVDNEMYYFTNKNFTGYDAYKKGVSVAELFSLSGDRPAPGIVTTHDSFAISWSVQGMIKKIDLLIASRNEQEIRQHYKLCSTTQWNYEKAKHQLSASNWQSKLIEINYRPFDKRWTVYDSNVAVHRRERVMNNYLHNNIGLMLCRQQKATGFKHALVHQGIVESSYVSNRTSEIGFTFPLYIYHDDGTRSANFSSNVLKKLTQNLKAVYTPEKILGYVYAILFSPSYRELYKEFLKLDFPKVPIPKNDAEFNVLAEYGERLYKLHLMVEDAPIVSTYPISGSNVIEKVVYVEGKLYINEMQYFGGVSESIWKFEIGGYQPAQKWLKDRKGMELSNIDIEYYQEIISILYETAAIMQKLDNS